MQNISREMDLSQIVYLNLFSNRIKKIKCLEKLCNLNTLILSFNEIEIIEGLAECKVLKRLDLNHNFIRRIDSLEGKQNLQSLNLTNNWISDIQQIEHLKIHCPSLKELSLKCNPIAARKSYRATVFSRLVTTLVKLDGIAQTDKDKERVRQDFQTVTRELIIENVRAQIKNDSNGNNTASTSD